MYPFTRPAIAQTQLCDTWKLVHFISFPRDQLDDQACQQWQTSWLHDPTQLDAQTGVRYPMGRDAQGILIYQPNGFMSAHLSRHPSERISLTHTDLENVHQADCKIKAQAFDEYMAYAGTWELYWNDQTHAYHMKHQIQSALHPNVIGNVNDRQVQYGDPYLLLSYDVFIRHKKYRYCLLWEQEKALSSSVSSSIAEQWFKQYQGYLYKATETYLNRTAWSPFIESPSKKKHPPQAKNEGWIQFQNYLHTRFKFTQPLAGHIDHDAYQMAQECSPYTAQALGIAYPSINLDAMQTEMHTAYLDWQRSTLKERFGIGMEILKRWASHTFLNTYATMHTTGQAFMLSFAGSGASSLDRGLEAIAATWHLMSSISTEAEYQRNFAQHKDVLLHKTYRTQGVGLAIVFACGSYPAWNAYPAIMANLLTGNSVLVKPHPHTILPMAIMINHAREVLVEAGYQANLLSMCTDDMTHPIGIRLLDLPHTRIVDFTGSQSFGKRIEQEYAHLQVYTETAGCNAVILESTRDLQQTVYVLAHALCFFSAQMCTAPQNLWISQQGIKVYRTQSEYEYCTVDEFVQLLLVQIETFVQDPKLVAHLCAALHAQNSLIQMQKVRQYVQQHQEMTLLRSGLPYSHEEFPHARTATPMLVQLQHTHREIAQQEHFAPISFLIVAEEADDLLVLASDDVKNYGAIASYLYSVNQSYCQKAIQSFQAAGASLGINLHRQLPIHFTAAMSDYHVTGVNPAGSACLTDYAFIARRFKILQSKTEAMSSGDDMSRY